MKRILIIDDEPRRAQGIKETLEQTGYFVIGILTWRQTDEWALLQAAADIVIVDANAPGRDTLEQICVMSTRMEKPLVVLGGSRDEESIRAAMRAGVSAYVTHDVVPEELVSILRVAAARFNEYRRLQDELAQAKSLLGERKTIDQAKILLMQERHISEAEAYQRMRKMAMDRGMRLFEVAEALLLSREI